MQRSPKLELISYTDYNRPFLDPCKDVEIVIKRLKIKHPIFIIE